MIVFNGDPLAALLVLLSPVLFEIGLNIGLIVFSLIGIFRTFADHPSWAWFKAGVVAQAFILFGRVLSIFREDRPVAEALFSILISVALAVLFRYLTQKVIEACCEK